MALHRRDATLDALAAAKVGLSISPLRYARCDAGLRSFVSATNPLLEKLVAPPREMLLLKALERPKLLKRSARCDRRRAEGIEEH